MSRSRSPHATRRFLANCRWTGLPSGLVGLKEMSSSLTEAGLFLLLILGGGLERRKGRGSVLSLSFSILPLRDFPQIHRNERLAQSARSVVVLRVLSHICHKSCHTNNETPLQY